MSNHKLRILIAEDSPEDREICRYLLSQDYTDEFEFISAETGQEALEQYESAHPDCMLLDYLLPDIDGLAVLSTLKEKFGKLNIPVIMLSSHGSDEVAQIARNFGAIDYINKDHLDSLRIAYSVRCAIEHNEPIDLINPPTKPTPPDQQH